MDEAPPTHERLTFETSDERLQEARPVDSELRQLLFLFAIRGVLLASQQDMAGLNGFLPLESFLFSISKTNACTIQAICSEQKYSQIQSKPHKKSFKPVITGYAHHFPVSSLHDGGTYLLSIAALPLPPQKECSYQFIFPRRLGWLICGRLKHQTS